MKTARYLTVLSAVVFPAAMAFLAQGASGCKKDEPEAAPTPTVAPPVPTPAVTTVVAPEEDAGSDAAADADADAHVPTGPAVDSTGIKKCCAALRGNMKTAPPEQQAALGIAAGVCDGMVNNPQGRSALASLRGILRGANMPAACQ